MNPPHPQKRSIKVGCVIVAVSATLRSEAAIPRGFGRSMQVWIGGHRRDLGVRRAGAQSVQAWFSTAMPPGSPTDAPGWCEDQNGEARHRSRAANLHSPRGSGDCIGHSVSQYLPERRRPWGTSCPRYRARKGVTNSLPLSKWNRMKPVPTFSFPPDVPIWVDPDRMSGTPCFQGTRVPVDSLSVSTNTSIAFPT